MSYEFMICYDTLPEINTLGPKVLIELRIVFLSWFVVEYPNESISSDCPQYLRSIFWNIYIILDNLALISGANRNLTISVVIYS